MTTRKMLRLATLITPVVLAGCSGLAPEFGDSWSSRHFANPYEVGKGQYAAGQYGLAVKSFTAAVESSPGSVEALNALAASYDQLGRFDLSARYYGRALALDPQETQTLNNIGYSYLLQKRYDLAVAYLRDAHAAAQDDPVVLANRKVAEVALQDEDLERSRTAASEPAEDTAQAPNRQQAREHQASASEPPARRGPARPWIERTAPQVQTLITEPQYALVNAAEEADVAPELASFEPPKRVLPEALAAPIAVEPAPAAEARRVEAVTSEPLAAEPMTPRAPEPVQLAAVPLQSVERVELSARAPETTRAPEAIQVAEIREPAPILGRRMAAVPVIPVQVAALPEPDAAAPEEDLGESLTDAAIVPRTRIQVAALSGTPLEAPDQWPDKAPLQAPTETLAVLPLVEVSNGAGRLRMAARLRAYLQAEGITVGRLTNADNFRHGETTIFYRDGWLAYAERLARFLPAVVDLRRHPDQRSDVRVELGGDLLDFDRELYYAKRRPDGQSG